MVGLGDGRQTAEAERGNTHGNRWWLVRFLCVWARIRWLRWQRRRKAWSDAEYYRRVYSLPEANHQRSSDKFAGVRAAVTGQIRKDPHAAKVLDLGCGFGFQARHLRTVGYQHVYACDLVPYRLTRGRELFGRDGIRWLAGDMRRLALADASMDAITISVALHDLAPTGIRAVLPECRRVLKPGGRLILLEPRALRAITNPLHRWVYRVTTTLADESPYLDDYLRLDLVEHARREGFTPLTRHVVWGAILCVYAFEKDGAGANRR